MRFSTTCKQGKLQVTDDGSIQVASLFGQIVWREPGPSVSGFDSKPGMITVSVVIHATQDHTVESVTKKAFDELLLLFPGLPVGRVVETETQVKSYKNAKEYQHDLKRMQRDGWTVQDSMDHHQDRSMAYKMLVPGGMFSSGTGQIVVTYQRQKR